MKSECCLPFVHARRFEFLVERRRAARTFSLIGSLPYPAKSLSISLTLPPPFTFRLAAVIPSPISPSSSPLRPLSGGHLSPPCIPSQTSPLSARKLSEMSPQDSLYAPKALPGRSTFSPLFLGRIYHRRWLQGVPICAVQSLWFHSEPSPTYFLPPRVVVSSQSVGWSQTFTCSTSKPSHGKRFRRVLIRISPGPDTFTAPMPVSPRTLPSASPSNCLPTFLPLPHPETPGNNNLIVFGGMALQSDSTNPEELCVLNDVRFFNLTTRRWLPSSTNSPPELTPKARYAHLSSVTSNRLFVIGGQDLSNVWLDDIYVFDLRTQTWTQRREYPRHCGTYRSVAVSSDLAIRFPQEEIGNGSHTSKLGPSGTRFSRNPSTTKEFTAQDALVHLPYSTVPTDDYPSDIYLFSNYNVSPHLYTISQKRLFTTPSSSRTYSVNLKYFPRLLDPTLSSATVRCR